MKSVTVSELNNYLKDYLEYNHELNDVWIEGEITSLKYYQLGQQIYFNLSDGKAQINCVVFSSTLKRTDFKLENGLSVFIRGKVQFYQKRGSISIQVNFVITKGSGLLSKNFEKLKAKLLKEGLFETSRKKIIPKYPQRIGLITAIDSAAMWDFITICNKLAPNIKISVIPAVMQGEKCPNSVIKALDLADKYKELDIITILRGGGSAEDLSPFNDEKLVRRIAKVSIPLISAIGHEIDYSLTDFVADLRMPTPTAAAQTISENIHSLKLDLEDKIIFLKESLQNQFQTTKEEFLELLNQLEDSINESLSDTNSQLANLLHRLQLANPLFKLKQGYSITKNIQTNIIMKSIKQGNIGTTIKTELSDGFFESDISSISPC
jgi:exodeoxyribonuclease VII large subunit